MNTKYGSCLPTYRSELKAKSQKDTDSLIPSKKKKKSLLVNGKK